MQLSGGKNFPDFHSLIVAWQNGVPFAALKIFQIAGIGEGISAVAWLVYPLIVLLLHPQDCPELPLLINVVSLTNRAIAKGTRTCGATGQNANNHVLDFVVRSIPIVDSLKAS